MGPREVGRSTNVSAMMVSGDLGYTPPQHPFASRSEDLENFVASPALEAQFDNRQCSRYLICEALRAEQIYSPPHSAGWHPSYGSLCDDWMRLPVPTWECGLRRPAASRWALAEYWHLRKPAATTTKTIPFLFTAIDPSITMQDGAIISTRAATTCAAATDTTIDSQTHRKL
jgi:hypothetical protein